MRHYPNKEYVHKRIAEYIATSPDTIADSLKRVKGGTEYFFELIHKTLLTTVNQHRLESVSELRPLELNLVDDTNAGFIALATQRMLERRGPENYGAQESERYFKEKDPETLGTGPTDLAMQSLQESAAARLLEMYLGPDAGTLFNYDFSVKNEWKPGRCAFWRYLMYSGFLEVDENTIPQIKKDSIPDVQLTTDLANRFINLFQLNRVYEETEVEKRTGTPASQLLIPRMIAEDFLKFNNVL